MLHVVVPGKICNTDTSDFVQACAIKAYAQMDKLKHLIKVLAVTDLKSVPLPVFPHCTNQ